MSQSEPRKLSLKEIAERSAKTLSARSSSSPIEGASGDLATSLAAFSGRSSVATPPASLSGSLSSTEARTGEGVKGVTAQASHVVNPFAQAAVQPGGLPLERRAAAPSTFDDIPASLPPMSRRTLPPQVLTQPPPADEAPASRSSWLPLAGGAVAIALAAGGFAMVSRRNAPDVSLSNASNATPPPGALAQSIDAQEAEVAPAAAPAKVDAKVDAKAAEPAVIEAPAAAAVSPAGRAAVTAKPVDAKHGSEKAVAAAEAPAVAPPVDAAKPVVAAAAPPAPANNGVPGELGDEIRKRVGASKAEDTVTAATPVIAGNGAAQERPSAGAVQGALNAVRGAAKACLDGQEVVTRVGIVLGSTGSVSSVSITGGAAGTPAEGCVRAAVMKAKVEPFTAPTFSTSLTLRP